VTAIVERTVLPPDGLAGVLALLAPESAGRATLLLLLAAQEPATSA
jgi:hypothetical protein